MEAPFRPFEALPLRERLFIRARWRSAPLDAMAKRAPRGRVADIGCGHGLLTAAMALEDPSRQVLGVDPDPRKIALARQALGSLPNVELREGTAQSLLPDLAGAFDGVAVADVLYLLPLDDWPSLLTSFRELLKPAGTLLLKEAEANGSWKHYKALAQEALVVGLLRKTRSSGGLGFAPRETLVALVGAAGFRVDSVEDVSGGYSTPHVLVIATRAAA